MMMRDHGLEIITLEKGDILFKEGDPGTSAYMIVNGSLSVFRIVNEEKHVIGHVGQNQIIGEMAIISGENRSASVEALEKCQLVVIEKKSFHDALNKQLPFFKSLINQLIERIRKRTDDIGKKEASNVSRSLCHILDLMRGDELDVPYARFIDKAQSILSLTEEHIDSLLLRLCASGHLAVRDINGEMGIAILDPERLVE